MATTAANSVHRHSLDSSMPRSRPDSSPWIHHDDHAPFDNDNAAADKKSVWNMPSSGSAEVGPVMGAASWPALSLSSSTNNNKSPSIPQDGGTTLSSTPDANVVATTTSLENHNVNGERKPFKRNNIASSSSTSNISNVHNHNQRGGSGAATHFRNSNRNYRSNINSYPRNDGSHNGHMRNNDHGFSHRNSNGRDMQRGFGMMRPHMPMGPPSFHMVAPQIGSYGGPILYPEYAPQHILMPHPPSEPMALVGTFPQPIPMYFPSFDAMLYDRILTQVEFYFSADNLSTDKYLREQMNDVGWVPVRVITRFKRLAEMTNNIHTILDALRSSKVVEIQGEAIRRRGDWDKYLLPREHSSYRPTAPAGSSSNASVESQLERIALTESRE